MNTVKVGNSKDNVKGLVIKFNIWTYGNIYNYEVTASDSTRPDYHYRKTGDTFTLWGAKHKVKKAKNEAMKIRRLLNE